MKIPWKIDIFSNTTKFQEAKIILLRKNSRIFQGCFRESWFAEGNLRQTSTQKKTEKMIFKGGYVRQTSGKKGLVFSEGSTRILRLQVKQKKE